jgi:predicted Zn-dependent protease
MDSLFDQSKLIVLAERLIEASRRAGADSADAVAMRSVSQSVDVRDGAVEESQRSEGDDMGLRVLVGRKQAVVSTNDMSGDGVQALAERAGRWLASRPTTASPASPTRACWPGTSRSSTCSTVNCPVFRPWRPLLAAPRMLLARFPA